MKGLLLFVIFLISFPLFSADLTTKYNVECEKQWQNGTVLLGVKRSDTTKIMPVVVGRDGCLQTNCYPNEVALGMAYGVISNTKFGHGTVGTNFEAVWDYSVTASSYNFIATAKTLYLSSSSANDDLGGTGGITVEIQGLDANYALLTETITLNGQTTVETTGSFLRVFRAKVTGVGTGLVNAGDVYIHKSAVSSGVPSVTTAVYAKIQAGAGQTLMGVYTVPAGYKMLVHGVAYSIGESAKAGTVRLYAKEFGSGWQVKLQDQLFEVGQDSYFDYPLVFPAKTDVLVQAKAGTGSLVVGCHWHFTLHKE